MKIPRSKRKHTFFRRLNNWLHLWLGLVTGAIMFVVCIMACVWVFNEEITRILVPDPADRYVAVKNLPVVSPSAIILTADSVYRNCRVKELRYTKGKPVYVVLTPESGDSANKRGELSMMVDPYSGAYMGTIPKLTEAEEARLEQIDHFFHWALDGHRILWLPWQIGSPIVNYSTLIFVIILLTGIVWWYPDKWNRSTRNKSFRIKWKAGWKRINLDLHNVLGFYAMVILLILALTGMVYGLEWYSQLLYRATNWGVSLQRYPAQESDSAGREKAIPFDRLVDASFAKVVAINANVSSFFVYLPNTAKSNSALRITAVPDQRNYYRNVYYGFDRYTGKDLPQGDFYGEPFKQSTTGEKIRRMNYDIHVGSIWGLPGKTLAFFCSLIGASLPVTGFIIWYNRKWGKKRHRRKVTIDLHRKTGLPPENPVRTHEGSGPNT